VKSLPFLRGSCDRTVSEALLLLLALHEAVELAPLRASLVAGPVEGSLFVLVEVLAGCDFSSRRFVLFFGCHLHHLLRMGTAFWVVEEELHFCRAAVKLWILTSLFMNHDQFVGSSSVWGY